MILVAAGEGEEKRRLERDRTGQDRTRRGEGAAKDKIRLRQGRAVQCEAAQDRVWDRNRTAH